MKEQFIDDLKYGTVAYDNHFKGFIYESWSGDEIFLGKSVGDAYKEYCSINGGE